MSEPVIAITRELSDQLMISRALLYAIIIMYKFIYYYLALMCYALHNYIFYIIKKLIFDSFEKEYDTANGKF